MGNTSVFYLLYLFWWHELIATIFDAWYVSRREITNPASASSYPLGSRLFLLGIYLVFIVVVFGLIASWGNSAVLGINMRAFLFRDILFTISLTGIVLNEWWLRQQGYVESQYSRDPFSGRMVVMHFSIIFGSLLHFMVVKRFPQLFTDENPWGSVIVCVPFLVLKAWFIFRGQHNMEMAGR